LKQDSYYEKKSSAKVTAAHVMNNKPTLLIIDGPEIAGRLAFCLKLAADFNVVVVGSSDAARRHFRNVDITYFYVPVHRGANPVNDLILLFRLIRIVRSQKPDIVHTFGSKLSVWGRLAGRIGGAKIITGTITGLGSLYVGNTLRKRAYRVIFDSLQRLASKASKHTVFQNSRDLDELLSKNIVGKEKGVLIPGSGVDTDSYSPEVRARLRDSARSNLDIEPDEVLVLMIARVIRTKGVIEFAQAATSFVGNAKFILVGPVDETNIDSLSEEELVSVKNRVHYLGARDDIIELLSATDIFVLPTRYREGIPRVVLEAAAMGLPIVTTREGAGDTAVVDGENGAIVDPMDQSDLEAKIESLIGSEQLRGRYGEKSRVIAETELSVNLIANEYADVFRRLLKI
jgi:N,N'-diacetylbacillosaminyl-diphospho-undecaprenol alpha-1,3-N-acetylgalactosaminyltransferase